MSQLSLSAALSSRPASAPVFHHTALGAARRNLPPLRKGSSLARRGLPSVKPATVSDHWQHDLAKQMVPVTVMLTTALRKEGVRHGHRAAAVHGMGGSRCAQSGQSGEFLGRVHRSQRNGGGGRIVLHCSAGVGRTGTFIALDLLAPRLQDCQERQEVSVYETVLQLRRCRVDMVQTKHQYAFIYKFLLNFVQKKHESAHSMSSNDPVYVRATSATAAAGRDNEGIRCY
uniref:protein-tyrosine-phosphatase n=1 Tax=Macrostomum lignano TaxID=282301 RepID=A0A1I8FN82_9PLAT